MATAADRLITEASILKYYPTGTGSPQGVVAAPEGTLYVETSESASNFMKRIVWVKKTAASTSTGWDILSGYVSKNITTLTSNITSGSVNLVVNGPWTGIKLTSVQTAGGTVEILPASGSLSPYVGDATDRFTIPNMQLANPSKVVQVEVTGRVVLLAAAANDQTKGTAWWPRTKQLPATWIGV